ncbi:MAG: TetR/AcrR family transcriptional regulator [Bacteroides sp.]|nr:TetR/AcrR family transcriptional regulator [Bacteroides sp.]MCM1379396.1 TetR/AcrR family transcriptional regulator [Bacteroides sp.]MCM1445256.1 TetR/AcrR family transcriptional regulator [Prevotella sp.]
MASRTRERLIDVARQLFVHQGIDNVTMNDIATASDRGRRTIYTYFRTKSEIYEAVVHSEATRVLADIENAIAGFTTPPERLRALMEFRIDVPKNNQRGYQVWFRSLFSNDAKRADSIRNLVNARLYKLIEEIINDGIKSGDFDPEQCSRLAAIITLMVRGSDWTQVAEINTDRAEKWRVDCIEFILTALQNRNNSINS